MKRTLTDQLFGISKVSRDRRKQNTDRQNILHFIPVFYSSRNQQLLRSKPTFKSTLIVTSQSVYAGMNDKFRNLSLWFRNFLNIDPRHWLPASVGIVTISATWLTITNPEPHAHLAFADVVTVTLNMADTVRIYRTSTTQVHNTVDWQGTWTFSTVESEIPAFTAGGAAIDSKSSSPGNTERCVGKVLGKHTLLRKKVTRNEEKNY